jgi:hypothetical protein
MEKVEGHLGKWFEATSRLQECLADLEEHNKKACEVILERANQLTETTQTMMRLETDLQRGRFRFLLEWLLFLFLKLLRLQYWGF